MIFVPVVTPPPMPPSPRTRELAGLLTKVLQEYTKSHPATTRNEIRAAFSIAARTAGPGGSSTAVAVSVAVGLALAVVLGGLVFLGVEGGVEVGSARSMIMVAVGIFLVILLFIARLRPR